MFLGIKCYLNQANNNWLLFKNLEISDLVEEKMAFKDIYHNWNLQTQIDKVLYKSGGWHMNKHLRKSEYR